MIAGQTGKWDVLTASYVKGIRMVHGRLRDGLAGSSSSLIQSQDTAAGARLYEEFLLDTVLPTADDLRRALNAFEMAATADLADRRLHDEIRSVQGELLVALSRQEIVPVSGRGRRFDPRVHEAVARVESDTLPAGTVALVHRQGFCLKQRLLRPAQVAVVSSRE